MTAVSYEARRAAAEKVAEAAMADMNAMLAEMGQEGEPGYDLVDQPDGWIKIYVGHDVVLWVDEAGEQSWR